MDIRLFVTVFTTIFIAEMGDKTQLATLLYAADSPQSKLTVLAAASLALIGSSVLAVLAGGVLAHYIEGRTLGILAGIGFIGVGAWMLLAGVRV